MKRHNQLLLSPMKGVLSVVDLWFNFFQMKVSCGKVHRAKIFEMWLWIFGNLLRLTESQIWHSSPFCELPLLFRDILYLNIITSFPSRYFLQFLHRPTPLQIHTPLLYYCYICYIKKRINTTHWIFPVLLVCIYLGLMIWDRDSPEGHFYKD